MIASPYSDPYFHSTSLSRRSSNRASFRRAEWEINPRIAQVGAAVPAALRCIKTGAQMGYDLMDNTVGDFIEGAAWACLGGAIALGGNPAAGAFVAFFGVRGAGVILPNVSGSVGALLGVVCGAVRGLYMVGEAAFRSTESLRGLRSERRNMAALGL
jgi:hypothetical protein